jgi:hypothetical protein
MSQKKIKNSNHHLIAKYKQQLGDYGLTLTPELILEAENELANKLAAIEKIVKGDIPYPDIIYYLVIMVPGLLFKVNKLLPLYAYSQFVDEEAARFGLINEDLFYTRKYLENEDLYSEKVNGHVMAILDFVQQKAEKQNEKHQYYYYLAFLLKEYVLLKEDSMKKALIYKMYDQCFDRIKMTALYQSVRLDGKENSVVSDFNATEYVHRSWLTNFKVE